MKPHFVIPDSEQRQRRAAIEPRENVWVSANAGSGKTRLLRDRVIRLLLDGVSPDRILCLTYTKAAAAEMQERIFSELARWIGLSDAALSAEITSLAGDSGRLERARSLFAEAIETPGGLKIQTIHAFAERLLHLFPLEAGVPVDFSVLDEVEAGDLLEQARRTILLKAAQNPRTRLGRAFATLLGTTKATNFAALTREALGVLRRLESREGLVADAALEAVLEAIFGTSPDAPEAALEEQFLAALPAPSEALQTGEAILALDPKISTRTTAEKLVAFGRAPAGAARLEAAIGFNFNDKGEIVRRLIDKPTLKALPHLDGLAEQLKSAAVRFAEARAKLRSARASHSLHLFTAAMLDEFQRLKALHRVLDFDDMILILRRLLAGGQSAWVMLKLDAAIEHILVDEAQDTTPEMWDIVRALADDFFAGEGQVRRPRSLFVVGDEKQSIYSFQGAEPRIFDAMRRDFARRIGRPSLIERPVRLNTSFRSSPDVLACVDAVFADPERRAGLSADGVPPEHPAAEADMPGLVECWPLEERGSGPQDALAPVDRPPTGGAAQRMAERIASTIAGWLRSGERHLSDGRPIEAGDILVLVQNRGPFFKALLRALGNQRVPVAGADRLTIQDEIGVQDLIAIASAALLPADDLTLATALKTPIFGLDETLLEPLCRAREGGLRAEIARMATEIPILEPIEARLKQLEREALIHAPFDFLARLLTQDCPGQAGVSGRTAMLRRLGADAAEAIDAFLSEALDFARAHPPVLALFIAAQAGRARVIKRELESAHGRVRVMTVHAAKGLEARIVFLADSMRTQHASNRPNVHAAPGPTGGLLLWAGQAADAAEPIRNRSTEARARAFEEYRRLLYVGLTRAKERLYVVGHRIGRLAKDALPEDPPNAPVREWHWHALVRESLRGRAEVISVNTPDGPPILRWQPSHPPRKTAARASLPATPLPLLRLSPLLIEPDSAPLRASASAGADTLRGRRRGIVLHRLFQTLPQVEAAERNRIGRRVIGRDEPDMPLSEIDRLIAEVTSALESPALVPFLAPGSRAELALAGSVVGVDGALHPVSARIDRLVIREDGVHLLDFKSGFRPEAGVPDAHLRQMALYRALARQALGRADVQCHLYWTAGRQLESLAAEQLDRAFATITSA